MLNVVQQKVQQGAWETLQKCSWPEMPPDSAQILQYCLPVKVQKDSETELRNQIREKMHENPPEGLQKGAGNNATVYDTMSSLNKTIIWLGFTSKLLKLCKS